MSRGKELTWVGAFGGGGVTALAASHCFRAVSYTAGISRSKVLVAGEGYVATDDSANRMARQRKEDGSFFWRGYALLFP